MIKEFEKLDTIRGNGLFLRDVIDALGSETYESSSGEDRSYESLMIAHTQKQHMKLTLEAEEYINQKFDELVNRYGSVQGFTDL